MDSSKFRNECVQLAYGFAFGFEDCLYLNVWTSNLPTKGSKQVLQPVMLFIHGGSLISGSGFTPSEIPWRIGRYLIPFIYYY